MSQHFICIGVQKAATTWLFYQLQEHPDLCVPERRKELNYFYTAKEPERAAYIENFNCPKGVKNYLDISPNYSAFKGLSELIYRLCPSAKILLILRDPVQRAISQYSMAINRGNIRTKKPFADVFWDNDQYIRTRGHYYEIIDEYTHLYELDKGFKVVFYDDLLVSPKKFLSNIYDFFCIEKTFDEEKLTEKIGVYYTKINISIDDINMLSNYYRPSNEVLYRMLGCEKKMVKLITNEF